MVLDKDEIILISENQTRKQLIDPLLAKMGWLKKYIKEEVNSVKSDFNNKHFVHFNVHIIESGVDRVIESLLSRMLQVPGKQEWQWLSLNC
jgi:hypothetical protein